MEIEGKTIILTTPKELSMVVVEALHSVLDAPGFLMPSKKRLLSAKEIGQEFGISRRTLESWRSRGIGPEYTIVGGRAMYDRVAFEKFVAAGSVKPIQRMKKQLSGCYIAFPSNLRSMMESFSLSWVGKSWA
ncbi:MAG: helix-turn-helix domain-containing protein [Desulfovibrio sp.]|nr:helix-turn-helix domain-containing protein [Desulfovibrio sp.]